MSLARRFQAAAKPSAPKPEPKAAPAPEPVKKPRAPGAGRPKADDPRLPVTLRVPQSLLEAYQAGGGDWRAAMVAVLARAKP